MITFDDLEPGAALGESTFPFTGEALEQWLALFPGDRAAAPCMPAAMVVMVMMRAYVELMHERPPGNVHAAQRLHITRLPALGAQLTTRLSCTAQELKRDRRWVTFAFDTTEAGAPLFRGEMTTIWAV